MTSCPQCGAHRTAAEHGPGWVVWLCPLCGPSRETHEPDVRSDLQREWDR